MSLLKRHRLIWLFVGLLLSTLVALFVVYDSRSPFSQFVRGYGTVSVDRWTAADLDAACIRLEPAQGTPLLLSLIHISEPTRLGMISYAVFCLKKKKTT